VLAVNSKLEKRISEIKVKEVEKPPYVIDRSKLRRFDSKKNSF
jgi:hypothetical protein